MTRKRRTWNPVEEKEFLINKIGELTLDIDWHKKQCKFLALQQSTAYHKAVVIEPSQNAITNKECHSSHSFKELAYGINCIMRKQGFLQVGNCLVRCFMLEMNIISFYPDPNLSKRAKAAKTYPYLLRYLEINRPNQVWSIMIYHLYWYTR